MQICGHNSLHVTNPLMGLLKLVSQYSGRINWLLWIIVVNDCSYVNAALSHWWYITISLCHAVASNKQHATAWTNDDRVQWCYEVLLRLSAVNVQELFFKWVIRCQLCVAILYHQSTCIIYIKNIIDELKFAQVAMTDYSLTQVTETFLKISSNKWP